MTSKEIRERIKKTGLSQMDFAFKAGVKYPCFNKFMKNENQVLSRENHRIVEEYLIQNHFTEAEKVSYSADEISAFLNMIGTVWLREENGEIFVCNDSGQKEIVQLPF